MFSRFHLAALAVLLAASARGQLVVSCDVQPTVALDYEPVTALVHIQNNTTTELAFFTPDATCGLDFRIGDGEGGEVNRRPDAPAPKPVFVDIAESTVITSRLTSAYDLRKSGSYAVQALVTWNGKAYVSEAKVYLDIVPGLELSSLTASAAGGAATRVYSLRSVSRDRMERLLLRIDDTDAGMCYGVYDLGTFVRRGDPTMQLDASGHVHILYQAAPDRYVHRVFAADGSSSEPELFDKPIGHVALQGTPDGGVEVVGAEATPPPEERVEP